MGKGKRLKQAKRSEPTILMGRLAVPAFGAQWPEVEDIVFGPVRKELPDHEVTVQCVETHWAGVAKKKSKEGKDLPTTKIFSIRVIVPPTPSKVKEKKLEKMIAKYAQGLSKLEKTIE